MNYATIPFLLTLGIAWASMGVVGSRYIGLVRENVPAKDTKIVLPPTPRPESPPETPDSESKRPKPPSEPPTNSVPDHPTPPTPPIDPQPPESTSKFSNPRFFDLLKDEEWARGNAIIMLVSNVMKDEDREVLAREIDQIRKDHPGQLVGGDVLVAGRDGVWLSSDWLRKATPDGAFGNSDMDFVASFKQIQEDLIEVDRRRPAKPARRLVLWQSALCPRSLGAGLTPRVEHAQVIWSGAQFYDLGEALDDVFGKSNGRVTTHGPVLDNLANTVKNVLGSPEPSGAAR